MSETVSIVGTGRVGRALGRRLRELGWRIGVVTGRSLASAREAARAIGNPGWRVAVRHILPNIVPPVLVQVGTNEMLLDDARRLARRASDAEVDVVLDITAKVPHVFQSFTGMLDEADQALDRAALFLRQHIRG